ncbi:MAG: prolipoprotein diacylglyceryl transferase [Bacteriovoracaceae bacterium]|nr:prolipoprotein diacylglyceryl transferase [Bacteriovoracaceae bacterium]
MTIDFNPVIFDFGLLQVRWYGMMYVVAFVIGTFLLRYLSEKGYFKLAKEKIDSLATHLILGMFLGARVFYVFIYNWSDYSNNLLEVFAVWKGGLSFHGAIIGMTIGCMIFAKRNKLHPMHITDAAVTVGAQGLFFGRLGNFINGELYGRLTDVPWGMIFPGGGPFPRHPSQLYEAIAEGLILFLVLWFGKKRMERVGVQTSIFLLGYGIVRFGVEFFREADSQMGYYFGGTFTMGQILCFLMIAIGAMMLLFFARRKITAQ